MDLDLTNQMVLTMFCFGLLLGCFRQFSIDYCSCLATGKKKFSR